MQADRASTLKREKGVASIMCVCVWLRIYGMASILKLQNTRNREEKAGSDSQFGSIYEVRDFHAHCQRTTPALMHSLQKEKSAAFVLEKIIRVEAEKEPRARARVRAEL